MKTIDLSRYDLEEVEHGAHGSMSTLVRLHASLRSATRDRVLHLVRRTCKPSTQYRKLAAPAHVEQVRRRLLEIGVPTVPTCRLHRASGDLYMTDLTENGDRFVFSSRNVPFDAQGFAQARCERAGPADPSARLVLLRAVTGYAVTCGEQGLSIDADDAFFFRTRKTDKNDADALIGDLKHVSERGVKDKVWTVLGNLRHTANALCSPSACAHFGWDMKEVVDFFRTDPRMVEFLEGRSPF